MFTALLWFRPLKTSTPHPFPPPPNLPSSSLTALEVGRHHHYKRRKSAPFIHNLLPLQLRILAIKFSTGSADKQTCNLIYKSYIQESFASLLIEFRLLSLLFCIFQTTENKCTAIFFPQSKGVIAVSAVYLRRARAMD